MDGDAMTLAELSWYLTIIGSVLVVIGIVGLVSWLINDLLTERAVKKAISRQK